MAADAKGAATAPAKKRVPYFTAFVETAVEVDPDDLHKAGWHYEDECKNPVEYEGEVAVLLNEDVRSLGAVVASLHRQAHPNASRSVRLCREEPCRSLTLDQLGQVDDDR